MGWMRGSSGNLSVTLCRDPLRLAVTASGLDKGELTAEDVVVVDAFGAAVSGGRPSAEAGLHARIAAVTGAGAVVHVHALAPVLAAARWPDGVALYGLEMLKGLGRAADGDLVTVPVIANGQGEMKGQLFRIARHLSQWDITLPIPLLAPSLRQHYPLLRQTGSIPRARATASDTRTATRFPVPRPRQR